MEVDKRQKVMLVIVAVCVLGMGGVWFALRDTGPSQRGSGDGPAAEVRVRETKSKKCEDDNHSIKDAGEMVGSCASAIAWEFANIFSPWFELDHPRSRLPSRRP